MTPRTLFSLTLNSSRRLANLLRHNVAMKRSVAFKDSCRKLYREEREESMADNTTGRAFRSSIRWCAQTEE